MIKRTTYTFQSLSGDKHDLPFLLEVRAMLPFLVFPQRPLVCDTLQRVPEVGVIDAPLISMSRGETIETLVRMVLVLLLQPSE